MSKKNSTQVKTSPFSLKDGEDTQLRLTRITALWSDEQNGVDALLFTGENGSTKMIRVQFGIYDAETKVYHKVSYSSREEFWTEYRNKETCDLGMQKLRTFFRYFNKDSRKVLCQMLSSAFRYAGEVKHRQDGSVNRNGSSGKKWINKLTVRFVRKEVNGEYRDYLNAPRQEQQYTRGVGEKVSDGLKKVNFFAKAWNWFMKD